MHPLSEIGSGEDVPGERTSSGGAEQACKAENHGQRILRREAWSGAA